MDMEGLFPTHSTVNDKSLFQTVSQEEENAYEDLICWYTISVEETCIMKHLKRAICHPVEFDYMGKTPPSYTGTTRLPCSQPSKAS